MVWKTDAIREKGVIMLEKRRRISRALHGVILPAVIHQLNAGSKGLGHLKVTKGLPDQAEVSESYKDEEVRRHVVYLNDRSCTCREWQMTGKPCPHALAVITTDRQPDYEKFVDMAYSVQRFRQVYNLGWPNALISLTGTNGLNLRKILHYIHQWHKREV